MSLIVGVLTIILVAKMLRVLGVYEEDLGCMTIIVLLIGLPFISNMGQTVINLFK